MLRKLRKPQATGWAENVVAQTSQPGVKLGPEGRSITGAERCSKNLLFRDLTAEFRKGGAKFRKEVSGIYMKEKFCNINLLETVVRKCERHKLQYRRKMPFLMTSQPGLKLPPEGNRCVRGRLRLAQPDILEEEASFDDNGAKFSFVYEI